MEFIKGILLQIPLLIASTVLIVSLVINQRKEKGLGFMLLGAISILILALFQPIFYKIILPLLFKGVALSEIEKVRFTINFVMNIVWSFPLLFIAAGIYTRNSSSKVTSWK